ncbi:Bug family tripartite tricarboxylate transporter substrate binding protein [Ramlibacter rhizophilus]|uniref:Tripartite tricarboxylate transporter substrate binding protein n=1 Tax=Ramlibacter rhizophilus TaxID=1781167 RepID=A0A4Z0BPE7_9BURK|nr:tripartite tricarboxylate transporter substrate binding protein [Ramlibacter rhizophilus]TFZ01173.1 tripartite tricarboxylate transporter substrate binding protein [Ramlibacter rhizophilus]
MTARRTLLAALAASAALAPFAAQAQAPAWPTKTVRILVGSPPGGPSDITTRLFAEQLQKRTGQAVVVENRPGAGNNLAAQVVAQAEPDGHTLVLSPDTVVTTNPLVYRNLAFDAKKDLVNVSVLATFTQLLVCNPKVGVKSVAELIDMAKKKPMTYASGGPAVPGHLAAEMFLQTAGIKMQHVPYKGPAPATMGVLSGEVDCGFLATPTVIPHAKAGKLTPLAISSAEPSPLAPDVQTLPKALNKPDADITFKLVLQAPRGTPQPVIAALEKHAAEIMQQPEVRSKLQASDLKAVGSTSEVAEKGMRADIARWEPVVKQLNLKMD